jgi:predicted amidohydrolase
MSRIAAVQMASGADKAANLATAESLVREAAARGAALVGLPENVAWMGPEPERNAAAESLEGPTLLRFSALARSLGIHLLAASVLFGPQGERLAVYRKMHLFDVEVGDGQTYRESAAVAPGKEVVTAETPLGRMGLSVCYDLRFPELYRALSAKGAVLLSVPSAFTLMTGKDHWEVLLRARAIENQAYVLAPAQGGRHPGERLTYGHALVVDPWGLVVACASEGEGLAMADMDLGLLERVRTRLPALRHRRL